MGKFSRKFGDEMWTFIDDLDPSVSWYPKLHGNKSSDEMYWILTWNTPGHFGMWDGHKPTVDYFPGDELTLEPKQAQYASTL
jgi:hypothetical protein